MIANRNPNRKIENIDKILDFLMTHSDNPSYILGHSQPELVRLQRQARLIRPISERFLRSAGVVPGMRVLDVGSGAGDVSFLLADLVGETGSVLGVDQAEAAIAEGKRRATVQGRQNVHFVVGDPVTMVFEQPFDAVVSRFVLQFQRSPSAMLRQLSTHLRTGGLLFCHELDWGAVQSLPAVPTFDQCCQWCRKTLASSDIETQMGTHLYRSFLAADLQPPELQIETLSGGDAKGIELIEWIVDLVAILLPEMERLGISTATEVDLPTLLERAKQEAIANNSLIMTHFQVGAWSRKK